MLPNDSLVPWQLALALVAVLTYALWFFSDVALRRLDEGIWGEVTADLVVKAMSFTRGALSVYAAACLIYVTLQAAFFPNWPELGPRLLPRFA